MQGSLLGLEKKLTSTSTLTLLMKSEQYTIYSNVSKNGLGFVLMKKKVRSLHMLHNSLGPMNGITLTIIPKLVVVVFALKL